MKYGTPAVASTKVFQPPMLEQILRILARVDKWMFWVWRWGNLQATCSRATQKEWILGSPGLTCTQIQHVPPASWRVPRGNQSELASGYPVEARFTKTSEDMVYCDTRRNCHKWGKEWWLCKQGGCPEINRKEKDWCRRRNCCRYSPNPKIQTMKTTILWREC
jgi:hypothetical protein